MQYQDYKNFKEALDAAEARDRGRIKVKYMAQKEVIEVLSDQLHDDIHRYASAIVRLGHQGKHIGVIGKNSYEYLVTLLAILYTGSVSVLLPKDYKNEEIIKYCNKTDTDALIYSQELEDVCIENDLAIDLICMQATELESIPSLQKEAKKDPLPIENPAKPEDLAFIIFTSGTTGESKAVMHSNRSLMAGVIDPYFDDPADSFLAVFPFHHVGGYCVALQSLFTERIICIGKDPSYTIRYLETLKPEYTFVVPAMMQIVCQKLKKHTQEELGWKLRILACGGAKIIPKDLDLILSKGIQSYHSYAASETSGRCVGSFAIRENLETIGKPGPLIEAKIVDGELVMGGPSIFMGYYKDEEQTAETLKDGWYYTGDLATIDKNGYYYLTGRKKNLLILSNGENISPEEIEGCLYQYPEIKEVLVREDQDMISAVIYPDFDEVISEEDRTAVKQRVHDAIKAYNYDALTYKQIRKVIISEEPLPKTATNKIKRW